MVKETHAFKCVDHRREGYAQKRRPKRVQYLVSRARCAALGCQTVISLNAAVFKEWNILCGHFSLFKNKSGMFWT